jgi:hypothetical protein
MAAMTLPLQTLIDQVEGRRFQRVPVVLFGRYMLESKTEYPCQTVQMSPGDILLFAPVKASIGEKVIVYLDQLGRFAGTTARLVPTGFAITMNLPPLKRDKLADQLTWFATRDVVGLPEDRRHERITPLMTRAILRLEDKRELIVRILDISISGVAVATDTIQPLGAQIVLGSTPAVIVRHFSGGFAGEFKIPFAPGSIDELTRL